MQIVNNFRVHFLIPLFCLQLFLGTALKAQVITLSAPATGDFVSNQSIRLLPGFITSGPFRAYIQGGIILPVLKLSQDQNYTLVNTLKNGGFTTTSQLSSAQPADMSQVVQYVDGLGRPLQNIQINASPLGKDIIEPITYDGFGRVSQKFLPYAEQSGDGSYRASAITMQSQFYSSSGWDASVVKTPAAYSRTIFEDSPLNRALEQGAPGAVWQPALQRTNAAGRTVVVNYLANNASTAYTTDGYAVRKWNAIFDDSHDLNKFLRDDGFYDVGTLYLTVTKNENWTSADGKVGTNEEYKDKEGRLILGRTFDLKGETIETLSTYYVYDDFGDLCFVLPPAVNGDDGNVDQAALDLFCYQYHYDGRKRLAEKKLPGRGWEFMAYNQWNQLILSQDANQANKDAQEVIFYRYDALGRLVMEGTYKTPVEYKGVNLRYELQSLLDSKTPVWEDKTLSGTGYTANTLPEGEPWVSNVLTVNYYDDYSFPGGSTYSAVGSLKTKGLLTGTKISVLGTNDTLLTINYYDDEGRISKVYKQHYQSGAITPDNYDEISYSYNFEGVQKSMSRIHHNAVSGNTTLATRNEYDHIGRKVKSFEQINSDAEALLSENKYNEIGQLKTRALDNGQQSTELSYNERGWLKSSLSDQFSFQLGYQDNINPQFNGNITTQLWGAGSSLNNNFVYTYDKLNRLTSGINTGMSETMLYDKMGNIESLTRNDTTRNYSYNGNQLIKTTGGPETSNYQYDFNGNSITDGRNGQSITYNSLNLPATVPGLDLSYIYDANGSKLKKISRGTTTDYVDGIEYSGGVIDIIQTEEGIARKNGNSFSYEYNLTDHLGNVRYTFHNSPVVSGQLERLQSDDYFPFGLRKSAGNPISLNNKYLYNGKEIQDELGQYDYGARFYDPVIGRFNTIDPLSEESRRLSAYVYGNNNPMRFIDPDGMFSTDVTQNVDGTYKVVGGDVNDGDKNIYVVNADGERTGETIGESLTMESFYFSETGEWKGTIDPNDNSGLNFLNNDIVGNKNLGIVDYMSNATGGGDYDFKRLGPKRGKDENNNVDYFYRGMPFGHKKNGTKVYASARDIGNYSAGYMAGKEGLSWFESRLGFDALQSVQEGSFSTESSSTQLGQKEGWNKGIRSFNSFIKRYKK